MLKPCGLGRRVAQSPHSILRQFQAKKKKTHQTKSITFRSSCHCDLFSPVETDSGALSGSLRQKQAISGRIRQFQAKSGPFQAFSGKIRQNQAESGKIRQNRATYWIWKIIGQGSYTVPRATNCSPILGRVFLGAFHQN